VVRVDFEREFLGKGRAFDKRFQITNDPRA
jgi:hypothetical protein